MLSVKMEKKSPNLNEEETKQLLKNTKNEELIITKIITKTKENENQTIIERTEEKVNMTKLVNESAKLLKNELAIQKIAELEEIFTKKE